MKTRTRSMSRTLATDRVRALSAIVAAVLLAFGLAAPPGAASAQTPTPPPVPTRVAGHVVQGTAGATLPEGLEVVLRTVDSQGNDVEETRQPVSTDGQFAFDNVPELPDSTYSYRVSVTYGAIRRTVAIEEAPDPEDIELLIRETTGSLDGLSIIGYSTVIEPIEDRDDALRMLELVRLTNDGDRTFVPDIGDTPAETPDVLRFVLPDGYAELSVESNLPSRSLFDTGDGFAVISPVPPGEYQLLMQYVVPHEGDRFSFARPLPLGAGEVRVLLPVGFGKASGDGLEPVEQATIGQTMYQVMRGTDYPRGAQVSVTVSGLPRPTFIARVSDSAGGTNWVTIAAPVLAGAVMAALLAYAIIFRRSRSAGDARRRSLTETAAANDR